MCKDIFKRNLQDKYERKKGYIQEGFLEFSNYKIMPCTAWKHTDEDDEKYKDDGMFCFRFS